MKERRNQARWVALMAATAIAIYLCWLMLQPLIAVLAWAAVLVIVFYPVHKRLLAKTSRPSVSAALSSLLVIITILAPLILVTLAVFNELSGVAQNLQGKISSLLDPNSPTGRAAAWLGRYVNLEQLRSPEFIKSHLEGMGGAIAQRTFDVVGGVVGAIIKVFFIIFTMYYLFRDGDRIVRALPDVIPLDRPQSEAILERTRNVIGASLYGVLVIAVIQGALGGLAFWALGLPSAIVWAVVMAFLSMIPMAGSFIVWVPAAIYLGVTGHWPKAIMLTLWGALVIGTVDNFLRPKLVGERVKLHELLIFFSVLGGLQVFGVLGIVIGPVVLAVTLALLDIFRQAEKPTEQTLREPSLAEETAALEAKES
jgi:predicted PurR-regulated permease PerM